MVIALFMSYFAHCCWDVYIASGYLTHHSVVLVYGVVCRSRILQNL
jgi:hypothetical protein